MFITRLAPLLAVCLLAYPTLAADNKTEAEIKWLKQQISQLQAELSDYKGRQGELTKQLRYSETEIGRLGRSITAIESQLQRQQQHLHRLQQRQAVLVNKRSEQERLISKQIRVAFELGRSSQIKLILNQQAPDTVARAIRYLGYVNQARVVQINAYAATLAELQRLAAAIVGEQLQLIKTRDQLNSELAQLSRERSNRETALAAINKAISSKDKQLANRKAERKRLEKLLLAVEQAVANLALPPEYRAFHERKGKMRWPVNGLISNQYGSRKTAGGLRWQGISLTAAAGTPVRSIHNGRVVFSDWFKGSGLLTIIDHGNGYMSLYAHNESLLRETGEWVKAGEPIATVGRSGGQQQSALYFEIRYNGNPVNPGHWCT